MDVAFKKRPFAGLHAVLPRPEF